MTVLVVGQGLKQASLGQCILKALKLSIVMPPLLFGLSVEIGHAIDRNFKVGYGNSYDEVK